MATLDSVKAKIQSLIARANGKTGRSDADMTSAVDALIAGYGQGGGGITPSGSIEITKNGTYDVTTKSTAVVNVPTPETPVGLNARVFTSAVSADATSGTVTISGANDWIASIRDDPNAFVMVRFLGLAPSAASSNFWLNTNFPLGYSGATKYNTIAYRQTASTASGAFNVNGLTGTNYGGHITVNANGSITCSVNSSFPVKAGTYQIIAGTVEML